jgi:hypothetical protein
MLLSLLYLVGAVALYILLQKNLPPSLRAERVRRPLRWAHGASSAFALAVCLLSWGTGWNIRYPWLWLTVLLSSGVVAGLRLKLGLVPERGRVLAALQRAVVPCAALLFLLVAGPGTRCYRDARVSLEFVQDTGLLSNLTTTYIKLYLPHWVFFEEYRGIVKPGTAARDGLTDKYGFHTEFGSPRSGATGIWTRSFWDSVTEITLDAGQRRGTIFQSPESYEDAQTPFTF